MLDSIWELEKKLRVRELFIKLLTAEAAVGAAAFAIKSFRIYLCLIVLACVNKACFIFLQAMGKAAESTVLSLIREVVFGVGFALILPVFLGLDGVLYSMPASDFLTFLVAVCLICGTLRELTEKREWKG